MSSDRISTRDAIFACMVSKAHLKSLQASRREGFGRLLLLGRRDFLSRLAEKMHDADPAIQARGRMLPYIDIEGTRSTDLARRMGVTKQAVARMVRELEKEGLLVRDKDKADGRALLVKFTEEGLRYLSRMHTMITEVEQDYESMVGKNAMKHVRATLFKIAYAKRAKGENDTIKI